MQESCFAKLLTKAGKINIAKPLIRRDGQFECRAFQVVDKNFEIVRMDVGVFGRVAKEIIGMPHDELIEGSRGCDKHSAGTSASSSCPAGTLPGRSNRSRITRH